MAALEFHLTLHEMGKGSQLIATKGEDVMPDWPNVAQMRRVGPAKAFYAPEVKSLVRSAVSGAAFIHEHGFYTYLNWVIGAEARRQRKVVVAHVHGFFDPWILSRSRNKKRVANLLFQNSNWRYAKLWRALTSKEVDQIRAQGFCGAIVVAPNGLRLSEIDREECAGEKPALPCDRLRPLRALFLSRLHPKKGLDILIPAWTQLRSEFPDWELIIVGPDEGGYRREVERMIKDGNVEDTCRILPAVQGTMKNAIFRSADLFLLPSYSEGLPMAVLEAAAHRLPIVISEECNLSELINAGAGWRCAANLDSFTDALRRALASSAEERKQRGMSGRQLIEKSFTWERISEEIVAACEACC